MPHEPAWWYPDDGRPDWRARLLKPLGSLWGRVAVARLERARSYRPRPKVICIGNFTAGGTGKTPLALAIAERLAALGERPAFLTRGYGGSIGGPHWIGASDTAADVGDEPLLLAAHAPVMVAKDRAAGAAAIEARGEAGVILMDDGLQNGSVEKDLAIAVVDGVRGVGNGLVIPAGPLRTPLQAGLASVGAVVVNAPRGQAADRVGRTTDWLRKVFKGPVITATTEPAEDCRWLSTAKVIAFAGIGAPERFFGLLQSLGAVIVERHAFADHQPIDEKAAGRLLSASQRHEALLVTTEKDLVRLDGRGVLGELRRAARPLPIRLAFDAREDGRLSALIEMVVRPQRQRP